MDMNRIEIAEQQFTFLRLRRQPLDERKIQVLKLRNNNLSKTQVAEVVESQCTTC